MCHVVRGQDQGQDEHWRQLAAGEEPKRDGGMRGPMRRRDAQDSADIQQENEGMVHQGILQTIKRSHSLCFFLFCYQL
jgi:hypothetical protein